MRTWLCAVAAFATILVVASNGFAQDVSWGLKGGLVLASLDTSGPGAFETAREAGGLVGGFVGVDLGRHLRLQPELYWSVRRFSATGVPTPFSVSTRGVEMPLLMQVRFPGARATQAVVFGGPHMGFIGGVTQRVGGTSSDVSDEIKNHDLAFTVGGGIERATTRGRLLFDVRAVIGARDLSENGAVSLRSRAIHALVGYRF